MLDGCVAAGKEQSGVTVGEPPNEIGRLPVFAVDFQYLAIPDRFTDSVSLDDHPIARFCSHRYLHVGPLTL